MYINFACELHILYTHASLKLSSIQYPGSVQVETPTIPCMHHLLITVVTQTKVQWHAWMIILNSRMYNAYSQGN